MYPSGYTVCLLVEGVEGVELEGLDLFCCSVIACLPILIVL